MPNRFRVLITSRLFRPAAGAHLALLQETGCELVDSPYPRPATEQEMVALVPAIDAILAGSDRITEGVLAAADRLKIIARLGVGYDAIDIQAATRRGVWVTVTPGTNEQSVADMTFCLLLALARRLVPLVNTTRDGGWERPLGLEIWGKTLGVVGLGRIGRAVVERARGFQMRVLAHDVAWPDGFAAAHGVERRAVDDLFAESDFLTLHAPLLPETRHLVNAARLALMKPTAYLVNTARGELVDEAALVAALRTGRPAGAALDVFAHEPPGPGHPLLALPQVVPTPHIAGVTEESSRRMAQMAAEQVLAALQGQRPPHVVSSV